MLAPTEEIFKNFLQNSKLKRSKILVSWGQQIGGSTGDFFLKWQEKAIDENFFEVWKLYVDE